MKESVSQPTGSTSIRGHEQERQRTKHFPVLQDVAVGDQPGHSQRPELLRVQHQVRSHAPIANPHYDVWLEPAVVPVLFDRRLEMSGARVHAELEQTAQQQVALRR
jgi:hypothetical protein